MGAKLILSARNKEKMEEVMSKLSNPADARYQGCPTYMYPSSGWNREVPFKGETNPSDSIIH